MHEIAALADTCSVFRNGRHVETFAHGARTDQEIVRLMIGRDITRSTRPSPRAAGAALPRGQRPGLGRAAGRLTFTVGKGEIVGLGGLDGQGQRELMLALFGVLRGVEGTVRLEGEPYRVEPGPCQVAGLRHGAGARGPQDRGPAAADGGARQSQPRRPGPARPAGIVDRAAEDGRSRRWSAGCTSSSATHDAVGTLSGGNQQKVVIGKWLMTRPRLILLNDPTRGIDVGTKQELYALMRELADAGAAILFYSTDYDELVGCCDAC